MKRVLACVVLTACGPAVGVPMVDSFDDGRGDDADASTGSGGTSRGDTSDDGSSEDSATSITVTVTTTESSSSSSSEDDGGTFIDIPPCFTHCQPEQCDPFAQDCPEGEKCVPWANDGGEAWSAVRCSPVDPAPASIGEPCVAEGSGVSGMDNCDAESMCWGVDPDTLQGECVALCKGTEDAPICPEGHACVSMFDDYLNVCVPSCDPLAPACAEGHACTHTGEDIEFACLPVPPFVAGEYGVPCDGGLSSCGGGFICVQPELVPGCADVGCCTVLADIDDPPVCPDASQTCIPLKEVDATMCVCGVPQ